MEKKVISVKSKYKCGEEYYALCPMHPDTKPSLSINEAKRVFYCHSCGFKGRILQSHMPQKMKNPRKLENIFSYYDEKGNLLYQILRFSPKSFSVRRPRKKGWIYDIRGVRRVLYNLPALMNAPRNEIVIIVEGEKKVNLLTKYGFIATCNPFGALKWLPNYNRYFKNRKVCIIPDNDPVGFKHAQLIQKNLCGIAEKVKILFLPDLKLKQDILDWLKDHTTEDLRKIIKIHFLEKFPSCSVNTIVSVLEEIQLFFPNTMKLICEIFHTLLGANVKSLTELKKELSEPDVLPYFLTYYCKLKKLKKFQKRGIENGTHYTY